MTNKMRILLACDGEHPIGYFIHDLKKAGLPAKAEILVLTVVESYMPPAGGVTDLTIMDSSLVYLEAMQKEMESRNKKRFIRAKTMIREAANEVKCSFREWSVRAAVCTGSPAAAIIEKAEEWKPDLIVIGSHGSSAAVRFFLGSVARSVLIHSRCSVRIVRNHPKEKEFVRVIIGVDGSPDSEMAVRSISERVWPKGTSVRLVTGFDQKMACSIAFHYLPGANKFSPKGSDEEDLIRQMTAPWIKKLEHAGLRVSDVVKAGKPWKVLAGEAEKWRANCIFVGTRGLGRFNRLLLGSVSNTIAISAHCSVEIVRPKRR